MVSFQFISLTNTGMNGNNVTGDDQINDGSFFQDGGGRERTERGVRERAPHFFRRRIEFVNEWPQVA